ncbi:nucleotide exchange factor GrpE [Candidatus Dojkabacteria bacterium]|nr:nucleotide exchange factor GrpE [Candidatus Dojkabacteria bacterium]
MIDKNILVQMIEDSKKVIGDCGVSGVKLDSANFQTKSKEDFEKFAEKFENADSKFLLEVDHAGRRIQVYDCLDESLGLDYIELTEPKPSSKLVKNEWEYVTYVTQNFDVCLKEALSGGYKVKKIREIDGTKYFYVLTPKVTIQIRNKSVGQIEQTESESAVIEPEQTIEKSLEPDYKEKYARLMADFENYRRIQEQQNGMAAVNSKVGLFADLVGVLDDFDRAIVSHPDDAATDGFKAIYDKLVGVLKENGVEEMVVNTGDQFSASNMEAVTTVPAPDAKQDNTVQEVLQKGYLHVESGKVIRLPKVIVAKFGG